MTGFLLSPDETMASIIDSSGVLTIYQLDDGLHELWTFTNSSSIHSVYWYEDGTALIVESALHVFYVDLETQEVNLIIYEGADGFSMRQGDWMSQQK